MRYDVPVFDPFGERGDDYFHPQGEAASHLVQITFTYRDIASLFRLLNRTCDEYEARLLTKFAVVEMLSLDEHVKQLVGLVLSGKTGYPIEESDTAAVKQLYGEYTRARKPSESKLNEIRNKIAAHRDPLDLVAIARIWDGVDAATLYEIVKPLPALFDRLKALPIYCWTKSEQTDHGPVMAYVAPMVWDGLLVESQASAMPPPKDTHSSKDAAPDRRDK